MKILFFVLLSTFVVLNFARPEYYEENDDVFFKGSDSTCGYDSCHPTQKDVLNIHIVPHTHDDVGWLKTVDQYYYGSNTLIQKAGVQYILDSVIDELMKDHNRRFVYVETSFFERWWMEQTDRRRHHVKRLVNEGRLEFAGGAWSMNDEAAAHYHSVLDQLTWGLRVLNDTFGKCGRPKAGWQIDPFGHSRELASMWAKAGFDGLLLGRVDYQDKIRRRTDKELEMLWRGNDDLGESTDILTGIMFNTYSPPPGFCFDVLCSDEPFIDDIKSPDYNVDNLVERFVTYIKSQATVYKTNNLIVTMGGDFTYQDALMWYKNLDKLIKYVNAREPSMRLIYSTPSCYIKSLYDYNTTWVPKQDDFFPYSSDEHSFWTGYFTSRPTFKYFERRGNNLLQICKQLYSMTNLDKRDKVDLNMLRTAMGIAQHHDAVTGTEKQHVAEDYARILEDGIQDCFIVTKEAINKLMSGHPLTETKSNQNDSPKETYYLPMQMCQLNITECKITENNKKFVVTVYNPLGHHLNEFIRIPVSGKTYKVTNPTGAEIKNEIVPLSEYLKAQLYTRNSTATGELIFLADGLPPLGYVAYYVEEINSSDNMIDRMHREINSDENSIENEHIKIVIEPNTGLVKNIVITENKKSNTFPLEQELLYYEGMVGNNSNSKNRASGAYIFRPNSSEPKKITDSVKYIIKKGDLVQEIHQRFSNWSSQIIRLYRGQKHVEFEWLVGPIPVEDNIGKEIISRFKSDIKSESTFFTDSNGRQMLKRIINKRPTWKLELQEPIAGNYYPCTSMISIKGEKSDRAMYVLTDRAQGCSSLRDGEIELMIHRRLLYDDAFGVEEPLNETVDGVGLIAKGTHYLVFGDFNDKDISLAAYSKALALEKLLQPAIIFTSAENLTLNQWKKNKNQFVGLNELPPNIHILTLEPWKEKSILLRLEHYIEKSDSSKLSETVVVNLNSLFPGLKITSVRETTLAANQWSDEATQLKWKASKPMLNNFNNAYNKDYNVDENIDNNLHKYPSNDNDLKTYNVNLAAMDIKTFIINVNYL